MCLYRWREIWKIGWMDVFVYMGSDLDGWNDQSVCIDGGAYLYGCLDGCV